MPVVRLFTCYLIVALMFLLAGYGSANAADPTLPESLRQSAAAPLQTGRLQSLTPKIANPLASTEASAAGGKGELAGLDSLPEDAASEISKERISLPGKSGAVPVRGFLGRLINRVYFWRLRYYFVAQNPGNCTLFYGLIQDDPLIGRASVEFSFPNGCRCHGYAQVTHLPKGGGVVGQQGVIKTKCTDGQKLTGKFITTSLTTGTATVSDEHGNIYQARFGQTAEQAVKAVNELRRKLGCPDCTAAEVEMRVLGRVLPSPNSKARDKKN